MKKDENKNEDFDRIFKDYQLYLSGVRQKSIRAIIVDGGKVALIKGKDGALTLPRFDIEQDEPVLEAAKKHAKDELSYEVEPIEVVDTSTYTINMKLGDVDFVSPREAYFCLCQGLNHDKNQSGELAGQLTFAPCEELKKLHLANGALERVQKYCENPEKNN